MSLFVSLSHFLGWTVCVCVLAMASPVSDLDNVFLSYVPLLDRLTRPPTTNHRTPERLPKRRRLLTLQRSPIPPPRRIVAWQR